MNKRLPVIVFLFFLSVSSWSKATLTKKLRLYGVIKPLKISTSVALGSGLVHKLPSQLGDKVDSGKILLQVLERETMRPYRSTIKGHIAKVHVTSGAAVSPGMPLVTVVDPKEKYMEISLSPTDAKEVREGLQVQTPQEEGLGSIGKVSPIIDPDTGAVVATVPLEKKEIHERLRIGEVIPIDIILGQKKCDLISPLSEVGGHGKNFKIEFVTDSQACLKKI